MFTGAFSRSFGQHRLCICPQELDQIWRGPVPPYGYSQWEGTLRALPTQSHDERCQPYIIMCHCVSHNFRLNSLLAKSSSYHFISWRPALLIKENLTQYNGDISSLKALISQVLNIDLCYHKWKDEQHQQLPFPTPSNPAPLGKGKGKWKIPAPFKKPSMSKETSHHCWQRRPMFHWISIVSSSISRKSWVCVV